MRTRAKSTIAVALLSMAIAGCSSDGATGPAAMSAQFGSNGKGATVGKPFEGDCNLVGQFTGPTTQQVSGTCNFSHLGRSTISFIETVNFETGSYESSPVIVAANGDELHVHIKGQASPVFSGGSPVGLTLLGTETTLGGTGRFAGASGTAVHTGVVTFNNTPIATATYHFEGRLAY